MNKETTTYPRLVRACMLDSGMVIRNRWLVSKAEYVDETSATTAVYVDSLVDHGTRSVWYLPDNYQLEITERMTNAH
jgi:hypothetical protein